MFKNKDKIFIVAEAGNNHEGNFSVAKKLVKKAAESGADAIKFQTFKTDYFINKSEKKRYKQLEKFKLEMEQFKELNRIAKKNKIIFFSTPLDLYSAKELNKFQKIFKISSGDNNYFDMLKLVLSFNKPTIISTGMTNLKLLKQIYFFLKKNSKSKLSSKNIGLLHCVSSYPTPFSEANLSSINLMKKIFNDVTVGYSDHTIGMEACIAAASLGAKIIEKHFTIDNYHSNFRDHRLSLDPNNFKLMVKRIRDVELLLGKNEKKIQNCEKKGMKNSRRGLVATKLLLKGSKINESDIIGLRPQSGISIIEKSKVLEKKLKKNYYKGEYLNKKYLR